ncbi:cytochrome P450 [Actinocorallia sp. A-T 12471]|uniref:cytochrome P450 n=1 Tax=Actinocorallia sp. A-T 12471 TaxID=3089813 RepID=UPI0029D3885E|nr:cytochrome P450 [Actinocorallia sp. A-T 12471]MDX6744012.1 cytochrome P450 [Actinocorallia sp. A-T 12471]
MTEESAAAATVRTVADLPWMDVDDPRFTADPLAFLAEHRARDWAFRSRRGVEIIRHEQVWRFLTDRALVPDIGRVVEAAGLAGTAVGAHMAGGMLGANGPDHTRLRGAAAAHFSPARLAAWRPVIRDVCAALVGDPAPGAVVDLVPLLCAPLPGVVFARMIGAPDADAADLCARSDAVIRLFDQDPAHRDGVIAAGEELHDYVTGQLAERRAAPGADLLSSLLAHHDGGRLEDAELVALTVELLAASTDNTTGQLATTLAHLLTDPTPTESGEVGGLWGVVAADPALAARAAVEAERVSPRVGFVNRHAVRDTVIDGLALERGVWIRCSVLSGHHDERVFADPDVFDPARADQRRSLVFGGGPHYCIGAGLAQVEIEEAVGYLAERFPGLRAEGPPVWHVTEALTAVVSLPVRIP